MCFFPFLSRTAYGLVRVDVLLSEILQASLTAGKSRTVVLLQLWGLVLNFPSSGASGDMSLVMVCRD